MLFGTLHNRHLDEPYEFFNLVSMIDKMEEIFDTKSFPQAFLLPRTFGNERRGVKKRIAESERGMKETTLKPRESGGSKCTFEITVKFRQNATWQGQILWAEKNSKQSFRSVLEMLKLMDEALTEGNHEPETVKWEASGQES